jgi:hypothetical protein
MVVDPTDAAKKQTFTGVVDTGGVQLTSVVWTAGTNQTHTGGSTVVDYATATHMSMVSKGILVEHAQAGTHAAATITSRTEDTTPASGDFFLTYDISATALKKATIANVLGSNPTSIGAAWASWTPTWTNLTVAGSTVTAKYTQVGKTVFFRIVVVLGGGNAPTNPVSFSLPVTAASYAGSAENQTIGFARYLDTGTAAYFGFISWASTTTSKMTVMGVGGTYANNVEINATIPHAWGNTDEIHVNGRYEAA